MNVQVFIASLQKNLYYNEIYCPTSLMYNSISNGASDIKITNAKIILPVEDIELEWFDIINLYTSIMIQYCNGVSI